ncbi:matrixin family metalloprotease [Halovenus salina]|uniref:matrixin family metalloprotease n=1 Tax=Halovenus salina TaxID=1510225 RepID=UPI00226086FA|nr:matrixin family metalloprotease [Halovenus salina]
MGQTEGSRRRAFLVAAGTVAVAGCLESFESSNDGAADRATEDGETATGTATPEPTHPLADRTATVAIEQVEADRGRLERLLGEAIAFWNDNHTQYLSYTTTLEHQPDADDPAILVSELPAIEDCGVHDGGEFAGCATYLTAGNDNALPATVRLVPDSSDWLYRTVIQHELGHVLGLGHDDEPATIMDDSIEARYPEFEHRQEILDLRREWINEYNAGADRLSTAFDYANDENYEAAAERYDTAGEHYDTAGELIASASETASGLTPFEPADRERLIELLDSERSFVESMVSAVDLLQRGSKQIASDDGGYDTYNEGVDRYNATVQQSLPATEAYVAAVGLVHITVESGE